MRAELGPVVAVINATRKIGAVAVPLNYRLTPEEARYVIGHSDAEIAYVDAEYAPLFEGLRGRAAQPAPHHCLRRPGAGRDAEQRRADSPWPRISRRTWARPSAPAGR